MINEKIKTKQIFITVWKSTHEMLKVLSKHRLDPMIKILHILVKQEYDRVMIEELNANTKK
jgi:hypothetical protein